MKGIILSLLAFWLLSNGSAVLAQTDNCKRVEEMLQGSPPTVRNEPLRQVDMLRYIYAQNNCNPLWYSEQYGFKNMKDFQTFLFDNRIIARQDLVDQIYGELKAFDIPLMLFNYGQISELDLLLSDMLLEQSQIIIQNNYNLELSDSSRRYIADDVLKALKSRNVSDFLDALLNGEWNTDEVNRSVNVVVRDADADADSLTRTLPTIIKGDSAVFKLLNRLDDNTGKVAQSELPPLHHPVMVKAFYKKQFYKKRWSDADKTIEGTAADLLNQIQRADEEGLNPNDYHTSTISQAYVALENNDPKKMSLAEFDVLLTDAAFTYSQDLVLGRIKADKKSTARYIWNVDNDEFDFLAELDNLLTTKKLYETFEKLAPNHPEYRRLKKQLAIARNQSPSSLQKMPAVEGTDKLELGMTGERVKQLRNRLAAIYPDKQNNINQPEVFDSTLYQMVVDFQEQKGLSVDGIAGKMTLNAVNQVGGSSYNSILMNMERWRWLPRDLGDRYILVNVPQYMLYVNESGNNAVLKKRVCVGKVNHQTPIFNDKMTYLEINPYWGVPRSIAVNEILPKLRRNSGYLKRNNMKIFSGNTEINPRRVNWSTVSGRSFRYSIRQEPSEDNSLGVVKFMFPNPYNVYIHDTPSKSLFSKPNRAFSHGCIRLENPLELAEYLLPSYSLDKINSIISTRKNHRVNLSNPLPVYIVYFTTWTDSDTGELLYLNDVYKQDEMLESFYEKSGMLK